MSDPYGYGLSNPTEQPVRFEGEVPLPNSIYANDPGISGLKANADHSHSFDVGGLNTPWYDLALSIGAIVYGGGFRTPQYCRVGSLVFLRGVVNCSGLPAGFPNWIGVLPSGYRPISANEQSNGMGFGGIYRIDIQTDGGIGLIGVVGGGAPNPVYVSLGSPYSIFSAD